MPILLKQFLTWLLLGWGLVVFTALYVHWVDSKGIQTLRFNQESCEYTIDLDLLEWRPMPYIVETYAPVRSSTPPEIYLHFTANRGRGTLYDSAACTRESATLETRSEGLPIQFEVVECPTHKVTPFSEPPGKHRLFGAIGGKLVSLGAGLYSDKRELVEKYRPQLTSILKTLKPQNCQYELAK
jgi:hypothetical protein